MRALATNVPFEWLQQLVRQLPGLGAAEPITMITLGLCATTAGTIALLLLVRQPRPLRLRVALVFLGLSTIVWAACYLGVLSAFAMYGRVSSDARYLMERVFPSYFIIGHLLIWFAYGLPRLFKVRVGTTSTSRSEQRL